MSLPTPSTPLDQRDPIYGAKRAQPVATGGKSLSSGNGSNRPIRSRRQPTATVQDLMVRRGSTVRVRQRALEKASKWPFCCLNALRSTLDRPATFPQDLSSTFEPEELLGLNRGIEDPRAPP